MEKAKYCICLNTYSIDKCDTHQGKGQCDDDRRELWAQGIGDISAKTTEDE